MAIYLLKQQLAPAQITEVCVALCNLTGIRAKYAQPLWVWVAGKKFYGIGVRGAPLYDDMLEACSAVQGVGAPVLMLQIEDALYHPETMSRVQVRLADPALRVAHWALVPDRPRINGRSLDDAAIEEIEALAEEARRYRAQGHRVKGDLKKALFQSIKLRKQRETSHA